MSRTPAGPEILELVTVTHNSSRQLSALLGSMREHLPGVRLVVVDCASDDDSVEVARASPTAVSFALAENVGYGRANNIGVGEVAAPVTMLVNPDVLLVDDSLLGLAREALRADRLLAPLVLNPDGSRQDTVHPVPGSAADLAKALIPPAAVPGRLRLALEPWRALDPRRAGWAVGCAVGGRTATLRRLGPFDDSIFLYGEDMELGLRAGQLGIQTWFWPLARVVHLRAHSSTVAFGGEPFGRLASARHEVIAHRLGTRRATLDDAAQAVTFSSRLALKRAIGRDASREGRQLSALRSIRQQGETGGARTDRPAP